MGVPRIATNEFVDKQEIHKTKKIRQSCNRHSPRQIENLEPIFKERPYPNAGQRHQLGEELGLEPKQRKCRFKNKRTQLKNLSKRSDNINLRLEQENNQSENNVICSSLNSREGEHALTLNNMRLENQMLPHQHERLLEHMQDNEIHQMFPPTLQYSYDSLQGTLLNQNGEVSSALDQYIVAPSPHIPSFGNNYHIHTPSLDQYITDLDLDLDLDLAQALHQDIPILTPSLDEYLSNTTPTPYQNVSYLTCPEVPIPHQNFPDLANGTLDQNFSVTNTQASGQSIPILPYSQDQDISTHISNNDRNIHLLDQNIQALLSNINEGFEAMDSWMLPHPMGINVNMEKEVMLELANTAKDELTRLLCMNEPYWHRSTVDGKYIFQRETYDYLYHKSNFLRGPHARIESSKDSRIVSMNRTQLVDMFLNSDKWVDLFPSIVKHAQTVQVFDTGSLGTRDGALQLMNAKMHILSPMIPIREFVFLRYCKQLEVGVWVITDVSLDSSSHNAAPPNAWKFPSGCLIHEITNESCRVSWVEHVEVDDNIQGNSLFRELICHDNAYGAERWVLTLERMCERFKMSSLQSLTRSDTREVFNSAKGRKRLMKLAHRMVKIFCGTLDMTDNMDVPHLSKFNSGGVRVSVRSNTNTNMQGGMIVSAATSFRLPVSPQNVFNFLKDNRNRPQWDALCNGSPVWEIQRISIGTNPDNFISIIQPYNPKEIDLLILQESYTHSLESMLIYTPIDVATLNLVLNGKDTSFLSLHPSGFTISTDTQQNTFTGDSLVTLMYQAPQAHSQSSVDTLDMKLVASINKRLSKSVEKIETALNI